MDRSPITRAGRERERDGILFYKKIIHIYVKNILIEFGIKISYVHMM